MATFRPLSLSPLGQLYIAEYKSDGSLHAYPVDAYTH